MTAADPVQAPTSSAPDAVVCPACDHANPALSRFCNACGSPVHLAPCPECEAINDRDAAHCYKCGKVLGSTITVPAPPVAARASSDQAAGGSPEARATAQAPPADVAPAPSTFERAAASLPPQPAAEPEEPSVHYLGRLSAPVDEAELAHVDPTVDRRARRARRLRYAVAALLVLPSVAATTLYGLEHQDKVDELIEFTRVALVAPLVRAAKDVLDSNRDADEPAPQPPPAPQPAAPAVIPAPQETTRSPALAVPPAGEGAASEPAHAADAAAGADASGADASAANTAH